MAESKSDEPAKAPTPASDPMRGKAPGKSLLRKSAQLKLAWST
jgi:hypothetical protein